jgi:CheY-like chemotaxis protein/two-component sensor histidine kinase
VRGDVTDALEQAREGASRVRTIVRDLKILSRRDEETVGPVELPRIVESSINMAFNEIRHRAKLVKQFGPVPRVLANEARLGQIFLNLLVNAAQAIPEGDAESNEIVVRTSTDEDGRAIVSVRDSGMGMTPETLRRIFDPFFTTKPIGVGTGLGLAICQSIAHSLNGEIQVESAPGKGSTFRVVLPAAHSDARRPDDAPGSPVKTRRGRVLVVDDEPMIGHAMHRLLGREHEVVALTRADAAMGKIDEGERFDVILCDLMMPDVTGMDFHGWLKKRAPREANEVIFLTGGVFTERAAAFVSEVPNLRLEKPIDARKLRSVVNERIAGRPPG